MKYYLKLLFILVTGLYIINIPKKDINYVYGPIYEHTLNRTITNLKYSSSKRHIIVIDSPGGKVFVAFPLISLMVKMKQYGHKFICLVDGEAYSMAATILQVCDTRIATKNSKFMQHNVYIDNDNPRTIAELLQMKQIDNYRFSFLNRLNISLEQFKKNYIKKERYFGPEEALKINYIDKIY